MPTVSIFLVDSNNLFRQGLKVLLNEHEFQITREAASLDAALRGVSDNEAPHIVLVDPCGIGESTAVVLALKAACPDAHLVLLTTQLDGVTMAKAIAAGADGFLMKNISIEALAQSLRLVIMGEKVLPSDLAALLISGRASGASTEVHVMRKGVSQREAQILRCLLNGDSNKVIANHLHITEATIKVHLKSLLRKIHASNRTQAAIWGLNNGFADGDEQQRTAVV
jgi:two-component system nitrate/nitrite response regulator NarL